MVLRQSILCSNATFLSVKFYVNFAFFFINLKSEVKYLHKKVIFKQSCMYNSVS